MLERKTEAESFSPKNSRLRGAFGAPRISEVAGDDHALREIERDLIDVRDGPSCLGGPQRSGMSNLGEERNAKVYAGRIERVVAPVSRGRLPQPGHHPQALEFEL